MISEVFDERWQAYAGTHVRITHPSLGELEVQPFEAGTTVGSFPDDAHRTIHLMTAQNPARQLSDAENASRQAALVAQLSTNPSVEVWSAIGGDPTWSHTEDSVAIVGLTDDEAITLARRFDQYAIFAWTTTDWWLISCRSNQRQAVGWRVRTPG